MNDETLATLAELEYTRSLLRELLDALFDDGYSFERNSPMSEWWNEDMRRTKTIA